MYTTTSLQLPKQDEEEEEEEEDEEQGEEFVFDDSEGEETRQEGGEGLGIRGVFVQPESKPASQAVPDVTQQDGGARKEASISTQDVPVGESASGGASEGLQSNASAPREKEELLSRPARPSARDGGTETVQARPDVPEASNESESNSRTEDSSEVIYDDVPVRRPSP
ncbi:major centromere autoantigen B-like [Entelurus aequoreus]|uniref:major centromere autoantigen B-like n=1 Tax=Entelurus aequoreus TaxID=161455 RepID=UPI002B1E6DBD|nr:major centromere autoantigen B-like [Entelurus aequoreus]